MTEYNNSPKFVVEQLTQELAAKYASELAQLADQIPGVHYSADDILAETKGERQLVNKWEHSLVVFEDKEPIAFVVAYERAAENNEQYPSDTIYISELAVKASHQRRGIATDLLKSFFEKNNSSITHPDTPPNYSIQTNSAEWNQHVVELYESFGFKVRATKEYPNRTDLILGVNAEDVIV